MESSEQGAWGNFQWRATIPPFMLVVHTFKFTNEISFPLSRIRFCFLTMTSNAILRANVDFSPHEMSLKDELAWS